MVNALINNRPARIFLSSKHFRKNTMINYQPSSTCYDQIPYNRSGRSGLILPALSLGLWHNFGDADKLEVAENIILKAFDQVLSQE